MRIELQDQKWKSINTMIYSKKMSRILTATHKNDMSSSLSRRHTFHLKRYLMNNVMSDQCHAKALMITLAVHVYGTVRNQTTNVNMLFWKEKSRKRNIRKIQSLHKKGEETMNRTERETEREEVYIANGKRYFPIHEWITFDLTHT